MCSACNIKVKQYLRRQDNLIGQFIDTKQVQQSKSHKFNINFSVYFIYFLKFFINFLKITFSYLKSCTLMFPIFLLISKLRFFYISLLLSFIYLITFEDPLLWLIHIWDFYLIFLIFCILISPFVFIMQF